MKNIIKVILGIGAVGFLIFLIFGSSEPSQSNSSRLNCHPSYSGCLKPNASDYDCAGGSGNGPYYTGRVSVIGPDVFGLDRDGDGVGCEQRYTPK